MKKIKLRVNSLRLLFSMILISMFLTLTAFADSSIVENDLGNGTWSYTITFEDAGVSNGSFYALVIVSGDDFSIDVDDIIYMDQKTAAQDGSIVFDNVIPKNYAGGRVYVTGLASPVYIGDLPSHGVSYSGSINCSEATGSDFPVVKFIDASQNEVTANVKKTADGIYAFDFAGISAGDYTLEISKVGHATLSEDVSITVSVSDVSKTINRLGDINKDGLVSIVDIALLKDYILGISTLDAYSIKIADVDSSGGANIVDLSIIKDYILGVINTFN